MIIRRILLFCFTVSCFMASTQSYGASGDLIADACVAETSADFNTQAFRFSGLTEDEVRELVAKPASFRVPTMSCEDLATTKEMLNSISVVIAPALVAIKQSGAANELTEKIAELGLKNPAVLGVMVVGAIGISFFRIVMNHTEKECEQQNQEEFKRQLFQEMQLKYGIHSSPSQTIQYQTN